MHVLFALSIAVGVVAALALPLPLLGRHLERRKAAAVRAVAVPETVARPSGPALADLDVAAALDEYETVVGAAYRQCASRIGAALTLFAVKGQIEVPAVRALSSIEIALLHLRHGVLEPASAYRPATTATSEHDFAGLRALLAAEDALA